MSEKSYEELKKEADNNYKDKKYTNAITKYTEALSLVKPDSPEYIICHNNIAQCYIKLDEFTNAIEHAFLVIKKEITNKKALERIKFCQKKLGFKENDLKLCSYPLNHNLKLVNGLCKTAQYFSSNKSESGGGGGGKEVNFIIGTINQYSNNSDNSNIVVGENPGKSACTLIATIAAQKILEILERKINLDSTIVDECVINGINEYSKKKFAEHLDTVDVFDKIKSFQSMFHRLENGEFGNLENNPAGVPILFECNNNLSKVIDQIIAKRTYNDKYIAVVITMRDESWCLFIPPIESKPYFFFNSHPHRELNLPNAFIALGTKTHICDFYKEVYPESNMYPDGNGGGNGTGYILQLQMSYSDKSGGGSRRKRHQKRKSARKQKSRNTRARRTKSRRHSS